jgi:2,4-dienoyl-CoA reductase-like NADH-dependent reductase (Old Yellow Enzyme family)
MAASQPRLVGWGLRLFGRRIFPTYPFEEAFLLPEARQFREALDLPLILLGGINRYDTITGALAEGFEFVAMARALLREPDLPHRFAAAEAAGVGGNTPVVGLCIHCNRCLPTIYSGTRCVLVDTDR